MLSLYVWQIRSKEISFANRNSILRKEGKSFKFALEFYNQVTVLWYILDYTYNMFTCTFTYLIALVPEHVLLHFTE